MGVINWAVEGPERAQGAAQADTEGDGVAAAASDAPQADDGAGVARKKVAITPNLEFMGRLLHNVSAGNKRKAEAVAEGAAAAAASAHLRSHIRPRLERAGQRSADKLRAASVAIAKEERLSACVVTLQEVAAVFGFSLHVDPGAAQGALSAGPATLVVGLEPVASAADGRSSASVSNATSSAITDTPAAAPPRPRMPQPSGLALKGLQAAGLAPTTTPHAPAAERRSKLHVARNQEIGATAEIAAQIGALDAAASEEVRSRGNASRQAGDADDVDDRVRSASESSARSDGGRSCASGEKGVGDDEEACLGSGRGPHSRLQRQPGAADIAGGDGDDDDSDEREHASERAGCSDSAAASAKAESASAVARKRKSPERGGTGDARSMLTDSRVGRQDLKGASKVGPGVDAGYKEAAVSAGEPVQRKRAPNLLSAALAAIQRQ